MKKLLLILSLVPILFSCNKETAEKKGTILFNSSIINETLKNGISNSIDKVAFAVVTIENLDGSIVYNNEKVELFKLGHQVLSFPLELVQGSYNLTGFYLVDSSNNVLFIAPKEGSDKAQYVNNALPIQFPIFDNNETKTNVEVISTQNEVPQAFGYSEFEISFIETFDILVSLFEYDVNNATLVLTDGNIEITGLNFNLIDTLKASNNVVTLLDNLDIYTIKISKNNVLVYDFTFSIDSIKQHEIEALNPLKVYVNNPKEITIQPGAADGKDARIATYTTDQGASAISTNYANAQELVATTWTFGGTPGSVRALLDFNLPEILTGKTVIEAKLHLTAVGNLSFCINQPSHSQLSGSNACYLSQITSAWEENTVTWNTQPTFSSENRISIPASENDMQNYVVDVTSFINNELANPSAYHGFMMQLVTEEYYRRLHFGSSDAPDPATHPKLVIKY